MKKQALEGEQEVPEEDQGLESTHCPEFPEEARQPATTAIKRAILPENAVNLPRRGEKDLLLKVLMADASFATRKATKRLTVQIEEINMEAEESPNLSPEASQEEDRDQDHTQEARKSKLTHLINILPIVIETHLLVQDQDPAPQKERQLASIPTADLPVRSQKNTKAKGATVPQLQKRRDQPQETPAVATPDPEAAQDQSQKLQAKKQTLRLSPSFKSLQKVNK